MKRRRRRKPIPDGRWITVRGRPVLVPTMPAWAWRAGLGVLQQAGDTIVDVRRRWLAIVDRLHGPVPNASIEWCEVP